jgi:hypothetical protein
MDILGHVSPIYRGGKTAQNTPGTVRFQVLRKM